MNSPLLQKYTGVEDANLLGDEVLLVALPYGWWSDHETISKYSGKPTMRQLRVVSAKTRDGNNPLDWIRAQPDAEVQYKLLMQAYKILEIDRPCVRSWVKVSKSDVRKITEMKKEGFTRREIAETMGRCEGTIFSVLERQSLTVAREDYDRARALAAKPPVKATKHGQLTQNEIDIIKQMKKNGCSNRDVARKLGRALSSVRYYINKIRDGIPC